MKEETSCVGLLSPIKLTPKNNMPSQNSTKGENEEMENKLFSLGLLSNDNSDSGDDLFLESKEIETEETTNPKRVSIKFAPPPPPKTYLQRNRGSKNLLEISIDESQMNTSIEDGNESDNEEGEEYTQTNKSSLDYLIEADDQVYNNMDVNDESGDIDLAEVSNSNKISGDKLKSAKWSHLQSSEAKFKNARITKRHSEEQKEESGINSVARSKSEELDKEEIKNNININININNYYCDGQLKYSSIKLDNPEPDPSPQPAAPSPITEDELKKKIAQIFSNNKKNSTERLELALNHIQKFDPEGYDISPQSLSPLSIHSPSLISPRCEDEESIIRSMKEKRSKVASELLSTEKTYVNNLNDLLKVFYEPMMANATGPENQRRISLEDVKHIFSSLRVILNVNTELYVALANRITPHQLAVDSSSEIEIGDVLLARAEYLKTYTIYCNEFGNILSTIKRNRENPDFQHFFTNLHNKSIIGEQSIKDYLILPVQRIPRYKMLLWELLKATWKTHVDYQPLHDAYKKISAIAQFIENSQEKYSNVNKIVTIQSKLRFSKKIENIQLLQPHRSFIKEIVVDTQEISSSSPIRRGRKMIIFNDLILFARANFERDRDDRKKKNEVLLVKNAVFFDQNLTLKPVSSGNDKRFCIIVQYEMTNLMIFFNSEESRDEIFETLSTSNAEAKLSSPRGPPTPTPPSPSDPSSPHRRITDSPSREARKRANHSKNETVYQNPLFQMQKNRKRSLDSLNNNNNNISDAIHIHMKNNIKNNNNNNNNNISSTGSPSRRQLRSSSNLVTELSQKSARSVQGKKLLKSHSTSADSATNMNTNNNNIIISNNSKRTLFFNNDHLDEIQHIESLPTIPRDRVDGVISPRRKS